MTSLSVQKAIPMTPAQKAAYVFAWYRQITTVTPVYPSYEFSDKICAPDDGWKPLYTQQAITEAVDAAVAPKDKRVKELEAALRETLEHLADISKPSECDVCNRGRKALEAPREP